MTGAGTFDEFYRGSRRRMFQAVYAMCGDAAEAQDAVQEAYARAWQRWSRVGGYGDPEAWVRTVARRIAISRWRKARNRLLAHHRAGEPAVLPGPDPGTLALLAALERLPAPQRAAIVLHHLVGLSVNEIAAETGVAAGTVKARLSRGRRALAALLDVVEDAHVRP